MCTQFVSVFGSVTNVHRTWAKTNTSRHNCELVNVQYNKDVCLNYWTKGLLYGEQADNNNTCGDLVITFVIASLKQSSPLLGLCIMCAFYKLHGAPSAPISNICSFSFLPHAICIWNWTVPLLFTKILRNTEYIIKEGGFRNDHGENPEKNKSNRPEDLKTKIDKIWIFRLSVAV